MNNVTKMITIIAIISGIKSNGMVAALFLENFGQFFGQFVIKNK